MRLGLSYWPALNSEVSTVLVGPQSYSRPILLPLPYLTLHDPRNHLSANIADTVALELKSSMTWKYYRQELNELAILLELLAHAKLVQTQAVVIDH